MEKHDKTGENYIAILYCHADKERVVEMVDNLLENGYRIWYEKWLNAKTEWTTVAERGLKGCRAGMAVLSNSAVATHGFRQRLNFLMRKKKPFFCVYLEPLSDISVGMKLQLEQAEKQEVLLRECMVKKTDSEKLSAVWGHLIYVRNNETMELTEEEVIIGRSEELCNYIIKNNSMIGRCHATIINARESCRLVDNNSLNGTYLNGHRLKQGEEYVLQDGDRILLANEEFIFYFRRE